MTNGLRRGGFRIAIDGRTRPWRFELFVPVCLQDIGIARKKALTSKTLDNMPQLRNSAENDTVGTNAHLHEKCQKPVATRQGILSVRICPEVGQRAELL